MKFTIEETEQLVVLEGDVGGTLCRVFRGTAENGAKVTFCVAHTAVMQRFPGWEPVRALFQRLDEEGVLAARVGNFLVLDSETETVEPKAPIEA